MSDNTQMVLGVVAGAVGARVLASKLGGIFPASIPPQFANAVPLGVGIALIKNKNAFARGAGFGMIAASGSRFLGELIPGIGALELPNRNMLMPQKFLGLPATAAILSMPASQANLSGNHGGYMNSSIKSIVEPRQF